MQTDRQATREDVQQMIFEVRREEIIERWKSLNVEVRELAMAWAKIALQNPPFSDAVLDADRHLKDAISRRVELEFELRHA